MIKDLLSTLLSGGTLHLILAWAICIVPLTLIKDLSSLTFVSVLSLGLSAFLVVVIIDEAPWMQNVADHGGLLQVATDYGFRPHFFTTISIFTEVFAWQHGIFQFFNSLRRPSITRWRFVTSKVNSLISVIYIIVSVPAYLGYLDDTTGDIFLSLPSQGSGSTLTNIARICFLFICIMTFPLEMLVARDVIKAFLGHSQEGTPTTSSCLQIFLSGRDMLIVLVLDSIALGLGILFKDLGDTCALVGAIGGSLASFIIPGFVYLGVNGDDFIHMTNHLLLGTGHPIAPADIQSNPLQESRVQLTDTPKPWWYYLLGFPVWCYVADWGVTGVDKATNIVDPIYTSHDRQPNAEYSSSSDYFKYENDSTSTILRGKRGTRGKFAIAICLIVAGFVTLVVCIFERF